MLKATAQDKNLRQTNQASNIANRGSRSFGRFASSIAFALALVFSTTNETLAQPADLKDPKVIDRLNRLEYLVLGEVDRDQSIEVRVDRLWKLYFKLNSNQGIPINVQLEQVFRTANVKELNDPPFVGGFSFQSPGETLLKGRSIPRRQELSNDTGGTQLTTPYSKHVDTDLDTAPNIVPPPKPERQPLSLKDTKNVVFLLDCSRSMEEKFLGRENKIEVAKTLIIKALSIIPKDLRCELRVFGQEDSTPGLACRATKIMVPLKENQRKQISQALSLVKPFGMTPLTYSLANVFERDLANVSGATVVVLISDGSDTCGLNPAEYVQTLSSRAVPPPQIVVASLVWKTDKQSVRMLKSLARSTGGEYYDNTKFEDFFKALKTLRDPE